MHTQKGKIIKMSNILSTFLKIGGIVLIMAILTQVVLIAIAPLLDLKSGGAVIDVFGLNIPIDGDVAQFRALMIFTMLSGGIMTVILFVTSSIFKDISREGTPFTKKNSNKIRTISLLLIANEIIIPPLRLLVLMIFVPAVEATSSINLGIIVATAVFFCLALIFEYGCLLQQESDETL